MFSFLRILQTWWLHINFDHSSLHAHIMICTAFEISIIKSKPNIQEILSNLMTSYNVMAHQISTWHLTYITPTYACNVFEGNQWFLSETVSIRFIDEWQTGFPHVKKEKVKAMHASNMFLRLVSLIIIILKFYLP